MMRSLYCQNVCLQNQHGILHVLFHYIQQFPNLDANWQISNYYMDCPGHCRLPVAPSHKPLIMTTKNKKKIKRLQTLPVSPVYKIHSLCIKSDLCLNKTERKEGDSTQLHEQWGKLALKPSQRISAKWIYNYSHFGRPRAKNVYTKEASWWTGASNLIIWVEQKPTTK